MMNYNVNKKESMTKMLAPIAAIVFALMMFVGAVSAQEFSMRPKASTFAPQSGNNAAANTMFSGARDLIDDAQWIKAEQKFAQYISAYPQERTSTRRCIGWRTPNTNCESSTNRRTRSTSC